MDTHQNTQRHTAHIQHTAHTAHNTTYIQHTQCPFSAHIQHTQCTAHNTIFTQHKGPRKIFTFSLPPPNRPTWIGRPYHGPILQLQTLRPSVCREGTRFHVARKGQSLEPSLGQGNRAVAGQPHHTPLPKVFLGQGTQSPTWGPQSWCSSGQRGFGPGPGLSSAPSLSC
jgi:hypothetical protein